MPRTTWVLMPAHAEGLRGDLPVQMSEQCATCRHLGDGPTCTAFPEGIPDDIWSGRFDHTKPHDGDHGLRYEPIAPTAPKEQQP